jgi:hypothetical protein
MSRECNEFLKLAARRAVATGALCMSAQRSADFLAQRGLVELTPEGWKATLRGSAYAALIEFY